MNGNVSLSLEPLKRFLAKHHPVIFITCITILLSIAIFILYSALMASSTPPQNSQPSTISQFDKTTIDRIKNLSGSNDAPEPLQFPSPRANPFVE